MTLTKSEKSFPEYYFPAPNDEGWNVEVTKLSPYMFGRGLDVGGGNRSPMKDQIRCDIDQKMEPDVLASGDKMPFSDDSFDYVTAIHVLEHFECPGGAIREWLRVLKPEGYICLIIPDREFTGTSDKRHHPKKGNEPMWHYSEWTLAELKIWIGKCGGFGAKLVDIGEALIGWSNFVILQKKE